MAAKSEADETVPYVLIKGYKWPRSKSLPVENFEQIQNVDLHPGDLVMSAYPRSGSNWTSYTIMQILNQGKFSADVSQLLNDMPFVDIFGLPNRDSKTPLRFKTHVGLPYLPFSPLAKYVVVIRNPFDCCISMYHAVQAVTGKQFPFESFFEVFLSGEMGYGDYFEHLVLWYELKGEPNVKLMVYEEMLKDRKKSVLELAAFLGQEHLDKMSDDTLDLVLKQTSFSNMKSNLKYTRDVTRMHSDEEGKDQNVEFIRKGVVGDWKTLFTDSQTMRLKAKMVERLKGTQILDYWLKILEI